MNRPGTVLVFALLAVLAMELLAMSAFGFARVARLGALHEQEHAVLQAAADDVLAVATARVDAHDAVARSIGATWPIAVDVPAAGVRHASATAERVSTRLLLLRAEVENGRGASARTGALLRILPPAEIMAGFSSLVTTALPPGPAGAVEGSDTTLCGSGPGVPFELPAWSMRAWADSLPFGAAAGIGWPDVDALVLALPPAPLDSPRAVVADADTTLEGEFRGLLIARGDVRLAAAARVRGVLVVRGALTVEAGALLEGVARALMLHDEGGSFTYDRCAFAAAIALPPFRRAYRPAARWRVPVY